MTPPRLLVTGASGFVGSHLLARLLRDLPEARILALGGRRRGTLAAPQLDWAQIDIADARQVAGAIAAFRPTHVAHLAAMSFIPDSFAAPDQVWRVNFDGAANVLRGLSAIDFAGVYVFASSADVYGAAFSAGVPVCESTPPQPASPYGRSKYAAELAARDLRPPRARAVILRLFNHSGPGQDERFALPSFAAQIARAEAGMQAPTLLVGELSARRDFLDVEDVVAAYMRVLTADSMGRPPVEMFNVASGQAYPIQDHVEALLSLARVPIRIEIDPARVRPARFADVAGVAAAFSAAYDWRPGADRQAMLQRILDYWRARTAS